MVVFFLLSEPKPEPVHIALADLIAVFRLILDVDLGHVSIEESEVVENEDIALETYSPALTTQQLCETQEIREVLTSAIGELKTILGQVVQLWELHELSTGQTAETLGLSIGAVNARTFRAG